jgi:hypothetical protein
VLLTCRHQRRVGVMQELDDGGGLVVRGRPARSADT